MSALEHEEVLATAKSEGLTPNRAALRLARSRVADARATRPPDGPRAPGEPS